MKKFREFTQDNLEVEEPIIENVHVATRTYSRVDMINAYDAGKESPTYTLGRYEREFRQKWIDENL